MRSQQRFLKEAARTTGVELPSGGHGEGGGVTVASQALLPPWVNDALPATRRPPPPRQAPEGSTRLRQQPRS